MWSALPVEIWMLICQYLSIADICRLRKVCRVIYQATNHESLWKGTPKNQVLRFMAYDNEKHRYFEYSEKETLRSYRKGFKMWKKQLQEMQSAL